MPSLVAGMAREAKPPASWCRERTTYAAFGAIWLAVILAAALGNYPTPLVGYSGSAILGYLISLLGLPPRIAIRSVGPDGAAAQSESEQHQPKLRAGLTAAG